MALNVFVIDADGSKFDSSQLAERRLRLEEEYLKS